MITQNVLALNEESAIKAANQPERRQQLQKRLRHDVESGALKNKMMIPNAVVGIVDIVNSSKISNTIPLHLDWELKSKFKECALSRAIETGMILLNDTGDGFLFLANYGESRAYVANLMKFYELLTSDFNEIVSSISDHLGAVKTGLRFGVSMGPIMLGVSSGNQDFMVVGANVNLAARLSSIATINGIVFSKEVWQTLEGVSEQYVAVQSQRFDLKGFSGQVTVVEIAPRISLDLIYGFTAGGRQNEVAYAA